MMKVFNDIASHFKYNDFMENRNHTNGDETLK